MPLTQDQVVDAAVDVLRKHGLADLTMRRLARELGVQPGALYWHIDNKQTLLVRVADRVLADVTVRAGGAPEDRIRRLARAVRAAVLPVPDGSAVVALRYALEPGAGPVFAVLRRLVGEVVQPGAAAAAATDLIVHHVLGCVGDEQDRRLAGLPTPEATDVFERGLELVLSCVAAAPAGRAHDVGAVSARR